MSREHPLGQRRSEQLCWPYPQVRPAERAARLQFPGDHEQVLPMRMKLNGPACAIRPGNVTENHDVAAVVSALAHRRRNGTDSLTAVLLEMALDFRPLSGSGQVEVR